MSGLRGAVMSSSCLVCVGFFSFSTIYFKVGFFWLTLITTFIGFQLGTKQTSQTRGRCPLMKGREKWVSNWEDVKTYYDINTLFRQRSWTWCSLRPRRRRAIMWNSCLEEWQQPCLGWRVLSQRKMIWLRSGLSFAKITQIHLKWRITQTKFKHKLILNDDHLGEGAQKIFFRWSWRTPLCLRDSWRVGAPAREEQTCDIFWQNAWCDILVAVHHYVTCIPCDSRRPCVTESETAFRKPRHQFLQSAEDSLSLWILNNITVGVLSVSVGRDNQVLRLRSPKKGLKGFNRKTSCHIRFKMLLFLKLCDI